LENIIGKTTIFLLKSVTWCNFGPWLR